MGLFEFFFLCVVVGLVVWALTTYIPMPQQIKTLIIVAAMIVLVLILLKALGVLGGADIPIPRVR
jgi:Flp pilus assembly protein protease CpaA